MLPEKNRIKKKKDFEAIFKNGKKVQEGCLFLKMAKNDLGYSRFAFIVSQKVSKSAVKRNKIRRQLVEIIAKREVKPGLDVVVVVLPGIKNASLNLERLIIKANV